MLWAAGDLFGCSPAGAGATPAPPSISGLSEAWIMQQKNQNEWDSKKQKQKQIHSEIVKGWDRLSEMTEVDLIKCLLNVRNYHIQYLSLACKKGVETGMLIALQIVERVQNVLATIKLTNTSAKDILSKDSATCHMILGGSLDFSRFGGVSA
jgi:hypothetical protein